MNKSSSAFNTSLAIIACLLWSTAFVGVKITLNYMSPLMISGLRFILAGIILLPFCGGITNLRDTIINHTRTVLVLSLFQSVLLYGSFFIAMQYVSGAVAAIVIGCSPLISALVAHIMMADDKMTPRSSLAIILGITGIVIVGINCKPWLPVGLVELGGIILLLFGSVVSAVGNVIVAKQKHAAHAVALNCSQIFIGGICLTIIGLIVEGPPSMMLPPQFYAALLWIAILSATAFSIWFYLLARIKVSKLNIWKFLIPVFGAITSWLFLPNESPTPWAIAGLIFVVAGIVTANIAPRTTRP